MVYDDTVPTIAELKANTLLQLFKRGYDTLRNTILSLITGKQDKLTAGEGIEIANNVISTTPAGEVYTKAEVNTLLEGKADTNNVVTLNTVQTISAIKIFTADPIVNKSTPNITMESTAKISEITTSTLMGTLPVYDGDSKQVGSFTVRRYTTESRTILQCFNASNTEKTLVLYNHDNNTAFVTAPTRTYSASNVNDIVTIGSLASNPNVVHTTGNEFIENNKTFTSTIYRRGDKNNNTGNTEVYQRPILSFISLDNVDLISFNVVQKNGATRVFIRVKNSNGTWKDVPIATGDGY